MIRYIEGDRELTAEAFLGMASQVWPGVYDAERMQRALDRTVNITAWDGGRLVGCVRILTDGYLFGTVPELLVLREYRGQGIGRALMARAAAVSPTALYFGAQPEAVGFYERLGLERSLPSFWLPRAEGRP